MDAGILAMLVDDASTILFANAAWNKLLGVTETTGLAFADVFGKEIASERQQMSNRVIASGAPEVVLAMVGGVLLRTTLRRIELLAPDAPKGVLSTSCPVREGMDLEPLGVAQHHDLGHLRGLTEREIELLHHVGRGFSSEVAASLMHRSTRTVEWHRASLGEKLRCANRVELARVALAAGITAVSVDTLLRIHRAACSSRS